jgi:hypothetical protein
MTIGPYLLVVIGTEEEKRKKGRNLKWFISPHCPDNPSHPIMTKIGKVGGGTR